jgi:hypothetical protein
MIQSFTPSSIKIPIFAINACSNTGSCNTVYKCAANTVAGCGVELSNISTFVNAVNSGSSGTSEIEDGKDIIYVSVQFCPDGDTSGLIWRA